jgi:hypothetical protein
MAKTIKEVEEEVTIEDMYDCLSTSTLMDLLDHWEFEEDESEVIKSIIRERMLDYTDE